MIDVYTTLSGQSVLLKEFDPQETKIFAEFKKLFDREVDCNAFETKWVHSITALYGRRHISRERMLEKPLYRVLEDMWGRLAIQQGHAEPPDYRDELGELIGKEFGTRREFCQKTGISEQLLSHALAHRKHIHIHKLAVGLRKVGYRVSITALPSSRPTARKNRKRSRSGASKRQSSAT